MENLNSNQELDTPPLSRDYYLTAESIALASLVDRLFQRVDKYADKEKEE